MHKNLYRKINKKPKKAKKFFVIFIIFKDIIWNNKNMAFIKRRQVNFYLNNGNFIAYHYFYFTDL